MDQTPNLQLPYIMPSQAQKHVTHNEAIRALDALVQMSVLDRDLATPPASPADGSRYLVASGGLDGWAGKDGVIAAWQDGAWAFFTPAAGWLVWVSDEDRLLCHDGAAFIDAAVHSVNPAPLVGVNAIADATNRLSVKSPASLFDNEGGDHRMKINKEAAGDTASVLFQSGYSGRAEFGLAGNDDWTVKVSADGAAWVEALKVDAATGLVRLPTGMSLSDDDQAVAGRHVREKLAANRTYYVRTDGSDANTGLVDSAGGAFLTIQKAWNVIVTLDLAGFGATIQLGDGTYAAGLSASIPPMGGNVTINGNSAAPANVLISVTGANAIFVSAPMQLGVQNLEIRTVTGGSCLLASGGGARIICGAGMIFGACASRHVYAQAGGRISMFSSYTISGSSAFHYYAETTGMIDGNSAVAVVGAPGITVFASARLGGLMSSSGSTFTGGTITGKRYDATLNAAIYVAGGGASYFPGSVAGTTATGGQYA